jgi:hypothetical protein
MTKLITFFLCCCLLTTTKILAQDVNPFLGQTIKKGVLKAEPDASSKTLLQLPIGSQVYSLTEEDTDGYLKVIFIKTNKIGWLLKSGIKKIRNIPLSKGNSFIESGSTGSSNTEVEITNKTSKTIALTVGSSTFHLVPHSTKAETIEAGFQYYTASAPMVTPLSGSHNFNAGSRYTWQFFIVTRRR